MGKHPRLAAAVLGLLTSLRERAALRIDHRLDLRSSLLVVALKGISNDHASLPAVSTITHSIDAGSWFPTRHRDRVNHATSLARGGAQVFDWTLAAAIAGGEQHQSFAPGNRRVRPVFFPLCSRLCWLSLALLALLRGLDRRIGPADFGSKLLELLGRHVGRVLRPRIGARPHVGHVARVDVLDDRDEVRVDLGMTGSMLFVEME